MKKCWARLRQRGKKISYFLPTVSRQTCKYRHTHTELGSRLWAQPSLHLEYTREKVGKWTKGTVVQHLPICVSLLPHTPSYLPPQNISSSTTLKKKNPHFKVHLHTGFYIFLLCLSIQKCQLYKDPQHAQLDATRGRKFKSLTDLSKRIRMISLSRFLQTRALTSGFIL